MPPQEISTNTRCGMQPNRGHPSSPRPGIIIHVDYQYVLSVAISARLGGDQLITLLWKPVVLAEADHIDIDRDGRQPCRRHVHDR